MTASIMAILFRRSLGLAAGIFRIITLPGRSKSRFEETATKKEDY
jgi:hypothetical protein